jgi:hypothetical protein
VVLVVILRAVVDPARAGIGLAIVALGLPVYQIFLRGAASSRDAATATASASPPPSVPLRP